MLPNAATAGNESPSFQGRVLVQQSIDEQARQIGTYGAERGRLAGDRDGDVHISKLKRGCC